MNIVISDVANVNHGSAGHLALDAEIPLHDHRQMIRFGVVLCVGGHQRV